MTALTPCQKCKAEVVELRARVAELERDEHSSCQRANRLAQRVAELEAAAKKRHECPNCRPCPCTETD